MQHIQSKPISMLNSWSHVLFRVSRIVDKPLLSLMEVYLNGKQLISREAERRSHVLFDNGLVLCRAKPVCSLGRVWMVVILSQLPSVLFFFTRFPFFQRMIGQSDPNFPCNLLRFS